jgi:heme exporter protein C
MPTSSSLPARPARTIDGVLLAGLIAVAGAVTRAIWFTPVEARQGLAQKIFYIHVPSAFVALYIAFALLALSSGLYLWLRDPRLDRMAESAAEVGLVYMSVVLLTGPIWGKTVWGTWWTWDARLTLTLFLWFLVLGLLLLRQSIDERTMRARYSAVLGLLAAILVPFIHLSVYLFRTLHPRPIVLKPSAPSLPGSMLVTLLISFGAFVLLFIGLLRMRYRWATERDELLALENAE